MAVAPQPVQGNLSLTQIRNAFPTVSHCTNCELHEQGADFIGLKSEYVESSLRPSPHVPALYLLGMNPGTQEDRKGRPFIGPSGQLLRKVYIRNVLDTHASVYIGNAVRCWTPLDAQPKASHYAACWHHTQRDLETIASWHQGTVRILCLGIQAAKSAIKNLTELKQRSFQHLQRSQGVPSTCDRYTLYFTFHPSAVLRRQGTHLLHAVGDHLSILQDAITGRRPTPSNPRLVPPRAPRPQGDRQ